MLDLFLEAGTYAAAREIIAKKMNRSDTTDRVVLIHNTAVTTGQTLRLIPLVGESLTSTPVDAVGFIPTNLLFNKGEKLRIVAKTLDENETLEVTLVYATRFGTVAISNAYTQGTTVNIHIQY
ncbi:MAG: hypothetical protein JRI72_06710 [Deltaproteobacteria bacterium]|nr:hypothetical protein [Deltaproteobacteria bacterium]